MTDDKNGSVLNESYRTPRIYLYVIIGILAVTSVVQILSTLSNILSLEHAYLFSPAIIMLFLTMFVWIGFFSLVVIDKKRYIQQRLTRSNKIRSFFKMEERDDTEYFTIQYRFGMYIYGMMALILLITGTVLAVLFISRYGDIYFTYAWPGLQTQAIVTVSIWALCLTGYILYIRKTTEKHRKRDIAIPVYLLAGLFIQNPAFLASRMGKI